MPAKPLFFAFSFPAIDFYEGIPVPPAPVTTATPGKVQVCVISAGNYYREQENRNFTLRTGQLKRLKSRHSSRIGLMMMLSIYTTSFLSKQQLTDRVGERTAYRASGVNSPKVALGAADSAPSVGVTHSFPFLSSPSSTASLFSPSTWCLQLERSRHLICILRSFLRLQMT